MFDCAVCWSVFLFPFRFGIALWIFRSPHHGFTFMGSAFFRPSLNISSMRPSGKLLYLFKPMADWLLILVCPDDYRTNWSCQILPHYCSPYACVFFNHFFTFFPFSLSAGSLLTVSSRWQRYCYQRWSYYKPPDVLANTYTNFRLNPLPEFYY